MANIVNIKAFCPRCGDGQGDRVQPGRHSQDEH